ncbi:MAG: hypothetical protein LBT62_05475 [Deltaproteobacteria bacterium]|nr:hypothetical protein [Deltaproteobacteria bacterium]
MPKRIPIDKALPGQILAEKLTRHDGVLLASQGSEISEGLLRMLARMNIDSVVVEEQESRTAEQVEADFNLFTEQLELRFIRIEPQSVLQALKKTMLYLAEKERDETLALINNPAPDETTEHISQDGAEESEQKADGDQPANSR